MPTSLPPGSCNTSVPGSNRLVPGMVKSADAFPVKSGLAKAGIKKVVKGKADQTVILDLPLTGEVLFALDPDLNVVTTAAHIDGGEGRLNAPV